MFSATVPTGSTEYRAIGANQTATGSTATLISLDLTPNERAAFFHGYAVSDQGEVREVFGVGLMVPEDGWRLCVAQSNDCALTLTDELTVEFTVDGADSENGMSSWIGYLDIRFTQNYLAS